MVRLFEACYGTDLVAGKCIGDAGRKTYLWQWKCYRWILRGHQWLSYTVNLQVKGWYFWLTLRFWWVCGDI